MPPGVTQAAILHGGSQGEVIAPVSALRDAGRTVNVYQSFTIEGIVDRDNFRTFFRDIVIPETRRALFFNTGDLTTSTRRAVVER